jgi:general secretion pathway protein D
MLLGMALSGCDELTPERPRPTVATATTEVVASNSPARLNGQAITTPSETLAGTNPAAQPYMQPGTGVFAVPSPPSAALSQGASPEAASSTEEQPYTLNFVNADVRDVVKATLGDLLGLNYTLANDLQGNVTLQTSGPIARSQILPILAEVLRLNGVAIVQSGPIYEVMPTADAGGRGLSPTNEYESLAIGASVRIIPLRYVSAQQIVGTLDTLMPVGGGIRADAARNVIIAWGAQNDLANIADFVSVLDVNWLSGMSFGLLPLHVADAKQVASELSQIFLDNGGQQNAVRLVPIDRLNAILVIAKQPAYLETARQWSLRLDQVSDSGNTVRVYSVQNRRAADVARILGRLFSNGSEPVEASVVAHGLTPAQTRSLSESTNGSHGFEMGQAGSDMLDDDAIGSAPASTASDLASSTGLAGSTTAPNGTTAQNLNLGSGIRARIIADDANNALVVLGSAQAHKTIESALKQLDVLPLQVLIEATIAEVSLNNELRYGLRWFFQSGDSKAIFTAAATSAISGLFPGFSYLFNSDNVIVAFNALKSITDVQVISAPSLLVLDNQTARLQVGDEVPVATQSAVSVEDPASPIVNQIEFRDTGVILKITPRVNAGGLVLLDISQEVSDVVKTTTSNLDSPTIQQRKIESTVSIQSGQTIALGGLIRDRRENDKTGVPILGDIPFLGNLFSETDKTGARTELLVLLKPTVIRGPDQARSMTEELRQKLSEVKPEAQTGE